MPSLMPPILSTAICATLERRLDGGGVGFLKGFAASGSWSLNEAERLTVTTEDEDSEFDLEGLWMWRGPGGWSEGVVDWDKELYMLVVVGLVGLSQTAGPPSDDYAHMYPMFMQKIDAA